ncbi:hypothetical protein BTN49_1203 [Candidatus Enterovibrio escicola]|uniref:Uncharacterized protein n=1 Tax=Candidatus Enterovibrio escicola TaxID=1927127 RepID=A0A2A5T4W7_9GAMM|nr:hypothetical protein BTN49_1203 [Candidatus Enterovibrio escacola]
MHEIEHSRVADYFRKFVGEVESNKVEVIGFEVSISLLMESYHFINGEA